MKTSTTLLAALAFLAAAPGAAHAALPTGNLLRNPGFEEGPSADISSTPLAIPGWVSSAPLQVRALVPQADSATPTNYRRSESAAAGAGCRSLLGPNGPKDGDDGTAGFTSYYGYQDVPVTAEAAGRTLRLGALLGRLGQPGAPSRDYGAVEAYFLDAAGQESPNPAGEIDNFSSGGAMGAEFVRRQVGTAAVPAGMKGIRVYAYSVATDFGTAHDYANGLVDDVKLTFDEALPADPPAGCQEAIPSTGNAGAITTSTAAVDGFVDTRHEDARYAFRYGANGVLDSSTAEVDLAGADDLTYVAAALTNLSPGTTYSYALVSRTTIGGKTGEPALSTVKTFTTAAAAIAPPPPPVVPQPFQGKVYRGNTFAKAVKITGPSCVKRGSTFRVSVKDVAEGTRTLRRFFVNVGNGVSKELTTKGPTGKSSASVTVRKIYAKRPKNTRGQKLIVSVGADFNGVQDPRGKQFGILSGSPDTVSGQKQFKWCGAAKKKKKR